MKTTPLERVAQAAITEWFRNNGELFKRIIDGVAAEVAPAMAAQVKGTLVAALDDRIDIGCIKRYQEGVKQVRNFLSDVRSNFEMTPEAAIAAAIQQLDELLTSPK